MTQSQRASWSHAGSGSIREILPPHTALAYPAMRALRPGLIDEATFESRVDAVQRPEGYRLVGLFIEPSKEALAVAGFRVSHSLSWGRFLYVDDLSTVASARRRGYGRQLLDWLLEEARRLDCEQIHLDSGVGSERADAHRLYLNAGFGISARHFARLVGDA